MSKYFNADVVGVRAEHLVEDPTSICEVMIEIDPVPKIELNPCDDWCACREWRHAGTVCPKTSQGLRP